MLASITVSGGTTGFTKPARSSARLGRCFRIRDLCRTLCTFNGRLSARLQRLYARLKTGDELSFPAPIAFLLQDVNIWSMIQGSALILAVMGVLICFSIYSWTIIFSKWAAVPGARKTNDRFLRAFRQSTDRKSVV